MDGLQALKNDKVRKTKESKLRSINGQGTVVRRMISAKYWLRCMETNMFRWYLALVSANHASGDSGQGPVSRTSRNFSGAFRVTYFSLYLQNEGVSRHETLQLFLLLFPLQDMKRPALHNQQVAVLQMAFRARKVIGTFEKRTPG